MRAMGAMLGRFARGVMAASAFTVQACPQTERSEVSQAYDEGAAHVVSGSA